MYNRVGPNNPVTGFTNGVRITMFSEEKCVDPHYDGSRNGEKCMEKVIKKFKLVAKKGIGILIFTTLIGLMLTILYYGSGRDGGAGLLALVIAISIGFFLWGMYIIVNLYNSLI